MWPEQLQGWAHDVLEDEGLISSLWRVARDRERAVEGIQEALSRAPAAYARGQLQSYSHFRAWVCIVARDWLQRILLDAVARLLHIDELPAGPPPRPAILPSRPRPCCAAPGWLTTPNGCSRSPGPRPAWRSARGGPSTSTSPRSGVPSNSSAA